MNPVQVERRRRGRHHSPGSSRLSTRPLLNTNLLRNTPLTLAMATGVTLAMVGGAALAHADTSTGSASTSQDKVGQKYSDGLQISSNQKLWPIGHRTLTRYGKFMGSTTSPNGRYLAATSNDKKVVLQIFDQRSHKLIWRVGTADGVNQTLKDGTVGQEGPTYSPDGKYLWLPQGDQLTRFPVKKDGTLGTPKQIALAKEKGKASASSGQSSISALPGKIAYSPDRTTVYVALNGQNKVAALNATTGALERSWKVGIAPRELAFVGKKLYVSNEGGRQARQGDTTINSYGTDVPADPVKGTSTNGTVSVINPGATSTKIGSIRVGLHPTALYRHGRTLYVANTTGDTVSAIDTRTNHVVQTINTQPYSGSTTGYQPTAMTVVGNRLLVTLARANAVAVYKIGASAQEPASYVGLLPTDYFPSDITAKGRRVTVTNTRGIDARGDDVTVDKAYGTTTATGHGTHSTTGSLTTFTLPQDRYIPAYTRKVAHQNGWDKKTTATASAAAARKSKPVAVPTRIGAPSKIKHVFLLVKENRSYDQILGDDSRGNGKASLAQFGQNVTPNQHALARQYGLFDNTYDVGTNSAEGHNWLMQGDNPEYTESSAGEYTRSYDTEDDVLGHQRSGFLWTSAQAAHKSVRNFGEFTQFLSKPTDATWQKYYCAASSVEKGGVVSQLTDPSIKSDTQSPIPSLNKVTDHAYPKFDTDIPDLYRYQIWKQNFQKNGPAALNTMWLSSDHTGGAPDARAQVADSDLAEGKIIDTISHSKYWKDSAIFVVEDDSQDGIDHVDGHRAPIQIISPYARRGVVNSTYYSQINMVRTVQQILGAQPLNQKLAAATPMYDAFTDKPDFTTYTAVSNKIPLTENASPAPTCGADTPGSIPGTSAVKKAASPSASTAPSSSASSSASASPSTSASSSASASASASSSASAPLTLSPVPAAQRHNAALWEAWRKKQKFVDKNPLPDSAPPEQMNRFTWYQAHNFTTPYPGDPKIYAPDQVPGANIPGGDTDDGQ